MCKWYRHRVLIGLGIAYNCKVCLGCQTLLLWPKLPVKSLIRDSYSKVDRISPSGWQQKHWCSALPVISAFIWNSTAKIHLLLDCLLLHNKRWESILFRFSSARFPSKYLSIVANNNVHWLPAPPPPSFITGKVDFIISASGTRILRTFCDLLPNYEQLQQMRIMMTYLFFSKGKPPTQE